MSNDYYNHTSGQPIVLSRGASAAIRSEFDGIAAGLEKLPSQLKLLTNTTNYAADTGAVNTFVVTLNTAASYTDGMEVVFKAANTNTGVATINVNNYGAKSITRGDGSLLQANDIVAGQIVILRFNSTSNAFQHVQASSGAATQAANSATAAANSATAAANSATASANSATASANSATAAATSAASIVRDGSGGVAGLTGYKLDLKNNAGTFTSTLENTNTAARAYVLPDRSGTLADNTDLANKAPLTGAGTSGTWPINVTGSATSLNMAAGTVLEVGQYIDFHADVNAYDYDVRINAFAGTGAGGGNLYITAANGLTCSGNLTAFSDERLKANWRSVSETFLAQWAQLQHGTYDRLDTGVTQVGVTAQGVQKILPAAVSSDENGILSLNYGGAALVATVQLAAKAMLQERQIGYLLTVIDQLVERVTKLEAA